MPSLLTQLKKRRIALALKQHDMLLRIGMSRQQYQRLEVKGNPRLDTLELIAKGLKSELMLIPEEKVAAVKSLLADNASKPTGPPASDIMTDEEHTLVHAPWRGLLEDDE